MTGGQGWNQGGGGTPGPGRYGPQQGGAAPQWGAPQGHPQQGHPPQGFPAPGQQGFPHPGPQGHPPQGFPGGRAPLMSPLADGEWHRLHPLTLVIQLVRLVFGFVIAGFAILMQQFMRRGGSGGAGDVLGLIIVGVLLLIVVIAVFNVLGYRATTFRVTHEAVEMRTGVLNKQHRIARLDRVQDIVIVRPFLPGLFGVAQAEVGLAGDESKFALSFLKSTEVDALRAVILQRASGAKQAAREQALGRANGGAAAFGAPGATPGAPGIAGVPAGQSGPGFAGAPGQPGAAQGQPQAGAQAPASDQRRGAARATDFFAARIEELTGPELSPGIAKEHSVVRIPAWRLIVAGFVNPFIVLGILALFVAIPVGIFTQAFVLAGAAIPFVFFGLIGGLATLGGQVLPALNYSIAGTPDGVRVGQGFLSTTNDTIPPGRVHAVMVSQPLWWRPFGWWTVRIARAGQAVAAGQNQSGGNSMTRNVLLPVGTREEVDRVLELILPTHMGAALRETVDAGLTGTSADQRFVPMPSRAWFLHPISFTRIGFRLDPGGLYSRGGLLSRWMSIVPAERIQGVRYEQSWLDRLFGVADLRMGIVGQFLYSRALSVDAALASRAFDDLLEWANEAGRLDTSHRWREAAALTAVASARMQAADAQRAGRPVPPAVLAVLQAERETEERFGAEAFREGRSAEGRRGAEAVAPQPAMFAPPATPERFDAPVPVAGRGADDGRRAAEGRRQAPEAEAGAMRNAPPAWQPQQPGPQRQAPSAVAALASAASAWAAPRGAAETSPNPSSAWAPGAPSEGGAPDAASTSAPLSRREARAREAAATGAVPVAEGRGAAAEPARPLTRREQREAEREAESRQSGDRPDAELDADRTGGTRS